MAGGPSAPRQRVLPQKCPRLLVDLRCAIALVILSAALDTTGTSNVATKTNVTSRFIRGSIAISPLAESSAALRRDAGRGDRRPRCIRKNRPSRKLAFSPILPRRRQPHAPDHRASHTGRSPIPASCCTSHSRRRLRRSAAAGWRAVRWALFEPPGYAVQATRHELDENMPALGASRLFTSTLRATRPLVRTSTHLYVLDPCCREPSTARRAAAQK